MDRELILAVASRLHLLSADEPGPPTSRLMLGGLPLASAFDCWQSVDLSDAALRRLLALLDGEAAAPRLAPVLHLHRR